LRTGSDLRDLIRAISTRLTNKKAGNAGLFSTHW